MKAKNAIIISLVLMILLAACRTTGSSTGTAAPESELTADQQELADLYDKYEGRLILDEAGSYVVQSGDTLSRIARGRYGEANGLYFPLIMLANEIVTDPDVIEIGANLTIPDLQRNLDNSNARQALKDFLREIAGVYQRKGVFESTRRGLQQLADSL
jgi:hypothetical protein